jgi:hypothetical protein
MIKGERGADMAQIESIAAALGVEPGVLSGTEISAQRVPKTTEPAPPVTALSGGSARLDGSRAAFLGRHRDSLAPSEIDFIRTVQFLVEADPLFVPGDQWWWAIVDAYRRQEAARRGRGDSGESLQ